MGNVVLKDRRSIHDKDYVSRLEIAPAEGGHDALLTVANEGLSLGKHVTAQAGHQVRKTAHQSGVHCFQMLVGEKQPAEGQFGGLLFLSQLIVQSHRRVKRRHFHFFEPRVAHS